MDIRITPLKTQDFPREPVNSFIAGEKLERAAGQFESLLVAQLLHISRGEGSGWLGTGDDATMSSAMDIAEEYLAQGITANGGLGLAKYAREKLLPGR